MVSKVLTTTAESSVVRCEPFELEARCEFQEAYKALPSDLQLCGIEPDLAKLSALVIIRGTMKSNPNLMTAFGCLLPENGKARCQST
jgi:hypothetical protein